MRDETCVKCKRPFIGINTPCCQCKGYSTREPYKEKKCPPRSEKP